MTFKNNWEKADQYFQLEKPTIEDMLQLALPNQKLSSYEIISGGCANLNIKISNTNNSAPLILRVYLRDKEAAYREQALLALVKDCIPVPDVYFVGDLDDYRFAITEYKHGITLRDLLLSGKIENIQPIMMEVGSVLAKIQSYRFFQSGFLDKDLCISDSVTQEFYIAYAKKCLEHPTTINKISKENISKIHQHLEKYHFLFPDNTQNHLVHADFDPANILVQHIKGKWKISAILDWEFAFSGSVLCDVANMLRYAHQMPAEYEKAFLHGLQNGGVQLPEGWRISIFLLNLLSLLDCLTMCPPDQRPNQCADICELITFIIHHLDKCHEP
jgi:aminoglycoside phosphotransferase (APT) family kinase protein